MFPFKKILFPVDYSEPCQAVVPWVREMANRHAAEIVLLHAYHVPFQAYADSVVPDPLIPEQIRTSEREYLRKFASEMFPGMTPETFVNLGDPTAVIDDFARREGSDLIMLPTHGRGPVRRFLLGSVAAKILHDISVPVWAGTSAAFAGRTPGGPNKSILCALEDNEDAPGLLQAAAAFAARYDARLSIVHVLETPPVIPGVDFTPYRQQLMNAANDRLRELKDRFATNATHSVVDDAIPGGIHKEAVRRNADLIIVGRGRVQGLASRAWSSLYSILRDAPCPVLSI